MQIVCISRKECLGILHIIIAVLSIVTVTLVIDSLPLGEDMNMVYYMATASALAFIGIFNGITSFVLNSKNPVTHTFVRLHNIFTITPLIFMMEKSRTGYFDRYRHKVLLDFYTTDIIKDINENLDAAFVYTQATFVIAGILVVIQGYLVYTRLIIVLCRRFRRKAEG